VSVLIYDNHLECTSIFPILWNQLLPHSHTYSLLAWLLEVGHFGRQFGGLVFFVLSCHMKGDLDCIEHGSNYADVRQAFSSYVRIEFVECSYCFYHTFGEFSLPIIVPSCSPIGWGR
jgi:hypothetical protein